MTIGQQMLAQRDRQAGFRLEAEVRQAAWARGAGREEVEGLVERASGVCVRERGGPGDAGERADTVAARGRWAVDGGGLGGGGGPSECQGGGDAGAVAGGGRASSHQESVYAGVVESDGANAVAADGSGAGGEAESGGLNMELTAENAKSAKGKGEG